MSSFEEVWSRVCTCAGQILYTKTGVAFTYRVEGRSVVPDRTGYPSHAAQLKKVHDLGPLVGPGEINRLVRGPAYVYAILSDPRIRSRDNYRS